MGGGGGTSLTPKFVKERKRKNLSNNKKKLKLYIRYNYYYTLFFYKNLFLAEFAINNRFILLTKTI